MKIDVIDIQSGIQAVKLTDDADWEPIVKWCGGRFLSSELADTGEYDSVIELPNGEIAGEGDWIIRYGEGQVTVAPIDFDVSGVWRQMSDEEVLAKALARIPGFLAQGSSVVLTAH